VNQDRKAREQKNGIDSRTAHVLQLASHGIFVVQARVLSQRILTICVNKVRSNALLMIGERVLLRWILGVFQKFSIRLFGINCGVKRHLFVCVAVQFGFRG
jgi:hypothetical protein